MRESIWLDESWVANSILEPTLRQMLYFERWVQSTPPLLLLGIRGLTHVAGFSEPILRLIPLFASLLGLVVFAVLLLRVVSPVTAIAGFALLSTNYWLLKYAQQLKQYGPDFLVSCVALLSLEYCLRTYNPRMPLILAMGGIAATFFAFTAVFWYIPCIVVSGLKRGSERISISVKGAMLVACSLGAAFLMEYFTFIRVNAPPLIYKDLVSDFFNFAHPVTSVLGLIRMLGQVLTGVSGSIAQALGIAFSLVIILGIVRAAYLARSGDPVGYFGLLGGALPLATVILVSGLGQYPILGYPRMLIWALPPLAILICLAIDPVMQRFAALNLATASGKTVAVALALVPVVCCALYTLYPNAVEENARAMQFLRASMLPDDLLFVHGGMYEQFRYYERRLDWVPNAVYVGNTNWPCCAMNKEQRATDPGAVSFSADVTEAVKHAQGKALWLFVPAARPGHWSMFLSGEFDRIPDVVKAVGCHQDSKQYFGQALVISVACSS